MAGLDLARQVFMHTKATSDQDHIDLFLVSCPRLIPDRTEYLLHGGDDPAPGIEACARSLSAMGATAIGVACNTAHSPRILSRVRVPSGVVLVNMIDSTCAFIAEHFGKGKIGIIATLGTIHTGIYDEYFARYPDLELVKAPEQTNRSVHEAIYHREWGIKSTQRPTPQASEAVKGAVRELGQAGCSAVILGCTELPLVFQGQSSFEGIGLIDPTEVLATGLIRHTQPDKLIGIKL